MLTLINIKKTNNIIEADYIPESSNLTVHAMLNFETGDEKFETIDEYGGTYGRMAINGLKRIISDLKSEKITVIPENKTVMWY